MAALTLYWKNAVPTGATLHRSLQNGGAAPSTATTTTGWVANQNAIAQSCLQNGGSEVGRTDATWGTTLQPSAAPSQTRGDCWRSELPLDGTFANANWTFTFGIRSVTAAYTGRLKLAVRVWRSSSPNGENAVELTGGRVASAATTANLSTSADTTVSFTWSPGSTKTLLGEYLFVNVGIEVTAAGTANTQDVDFRVGSAYTIATSDFTPSPVPGNQSSSSFAAVAAMAVLAIGAAIMPANFATLAPIADAPLTDGNIVAATPAPDALLLRQIIPDGSQRSRVIYDPVPSTDVVRSPLYIAHRQVAPVLFVGADTSQRQPVALQVVAQPPPFVNPQSLAPVSAEWITGDTTLGVPKTLIQDAQAPIGDVQIHVAPDRVRPVTDTSRGTPKTLTEDAQLPVGDAQTFTQPDRLRPVVDTSGETPKTLVADAQAPVGETQVHSAPDRLRPVVAASYGTPKALFADAQLPVGSETPASAPDARRIGGDTSSSAWPLAQAVVAAAPTVPVSTLAVADSRRLGADTSTSAWPIAQAVVAAAPTVPTLGLPIADWRELGADTGRGTSKSLIADAQLPVGADQVYTQPDRVRQVADTSLGTPMTLVVAVVDAPYTRSRVVNAGAAGGTGYTRGSIVNSGSV
jgi:hypothetical protein